MRARRWLHGFAFQLIDAILFLDIRALFGALHGRVRGYARYCRATHNLQHSFPDATAGQLAELDDDCAICKEPMQASYPAQVVSGLHETS